MKNIEHFVSEVANEFCLYKNSCQVRLWVQNLVRSLTKPLGACVTYQ